MSDALLFFKTFLANPFAIGSIIPSSKHLVADLLDGVDFTTAKSIVEYGPGTGVFTDEIVRRLAPDAKFLCIEIMDDFYNTLKARYDDPRVILIHGSAADVEKLLAEHGMGQADAIVSGLPFTSLPDDLRREILGATTRALKPAGRLVLYQYSQFVMGHLRKYFGAIQTRYTFLNVPPAFSFYCDQPIVTAGAPAATP